MREPLTAQHLTWRNKLGRLVWQLVWLTLYRLSPTPLHAWRCWLLRLFGAHIDAGAHPYPSARIWAPWNLTMGRNACLGPDVDCYCVAPVLIGDHATVSQYSHLCTASHDHRNSSFTLVAAPIHIEAQAWVTAGAFIGPGVHIGTGAVVGARAVITKSVAPWTVVAGNPQRVVGQRPPQTRA